MKVLQINSTDRGSTGSISSKLAGNLISEGHFSIIKYGRSTNTREFFLRNAISQFGFLYHIFKTRVFDNHGLASDSATRHFVSEIKVFSPEIIHLHNLHGYFINVKILFDFLKSANVNVVWTFHDCWPFTGHCSHFQYVKCDRWMVQCYKCPNKHGYPASYFIDNSRKNFIRKKEIFTGVKNLTLVAPCIWMKNNLERSFLKEYPIEVIYNGIDLDVFKPAPAALFRSKLKINCAKIVLGVSSTWTERKGLNDIRLLRKKLQKDFLIVLVGLKAKQIRNLPPGIFGIVRTESKKELAEIYSSADVFINPTYSDTFPTVNLEALACGTPVITYETGGCGEAIDENTGISVAPGDTDGLLEAIYKITTAGKESYRDKCRLRAVKLFDQKRMADEYLGLYQRINEHSI